MKLPSSSMQYLVAGGFLFAAFLVLRRDVQSIASGAVDVAATVAEGVNPLNPDNVFARASNGVAQIVTGDKGTSLGSALYDWLNPGAQKTVDDLLAPSPMPKRGPYGQ